MRKLVTLFLSVGVLCVPALRASTTYAINFATTTGTAPASGSFTYDPSTGFSSFLVSWSGNTFNLAAAANGPVNAGTPTNCTGEGANFAYGFLIMTQAVTGCPTAPTYGWQGVHILAGQAGFIFSVSYPSGPINIGDLISGLSGTTTNTGSGVWSLTAVPEPATSSLLLLGTLVLVAIKRSGKLPSF